MNALSIELIQLIFDFLNFHDQINFKSLNRHYHYKLKEYDLYNIPRRFKDKLNDQILKNYPALSVHFLQ